jgi:hypothetical protein
MEQRPDLLRAEGNFYPSEGVIAMRKIGSPGLKFLKMMHLLLIVLFLGGILSSLALLMSLDLTDFNQVYLTYRNFGVISDQVVKIGAQGTILLGLIYGLFTRWGFIKHKWLLFIIQTVVGILVVDNLMTANLTLLETQKALALDNSIFIHNHYIRFYVVIAQIGLTLLALILSVLKPGRSKPFPAATA